jgi:hypothetical protein
MRNTLPPNATPLVAVADEVVERLARLEEQMRHVVSAVEKLANRDAELDASFRAMSDKFSAALTERADMFRESLESVTDKFVSRDDWAFWKSLLTTAFLALIAFGWNALINGWHR